MFNLLMQYAPWGAGRNTIHSSRIFEYTDTSIASTFKNGNTALLDKLIISPCLFMQEGIGDQLAHVAQITRARPVGAEVLIEYTFDTAIPPVLNSVIYANRLDFDMPQEFEFSRGHWAVKNVDLYRLLLRHAQPRRQRPSVFTIPEHEKIEPVLVSAMMPFDGSFTPVYESLKATTSKMGLRCRRADDIWENAAIIQDVVSLIDKSHLVICDCSGRNPNVFYEIGIAHTLGREVILITQNEADIPFDLRHLRYVKYLNNVEGREQLCAALEARITTLFDT